MPQSLKKPSGTKPKRGNFEKGDWYDVPQFYDAVFDEGTPVEADFLERVWELHNECGKRNKKRSGGLRVLEPACGSGRLMLEMAKRKHRVAGFDANPHMLKAARTKLDSHKLSGKLFQARMEDFQCPGRFDLIHCLLSTFKYLQTDKDAVSHLERAANSLTKGGIYVLGLHLTDYDRKREQSERWLGTGEGFRVTSVTRTGLPDQRRRYEWLRNRIHVRFDRPDPKRNRPREFKLETRWMCRTYDAAQIRRILGRVPSLKCVACYDFTHDPESPRDLDDSQEDIVLILVKG